jgi:Ni/Co efflux regulator RcnB
MFKSRTLAVAGSVAALSFAAVPIAQAATTHHHPTAARVDASRDAKGVRHVDRTPDRTRADSPRDVRDR